jgi:hypothetical protein
MAINEDQELQIFFNTQGSMREADSESNVAYSAPDFGNDIVTQLCEIDQVKSFESMKIGLMAIWITNAT